MNATPPVVERIAAYNRGRDPERLALKYQALRQSSFTFLRGTCHLFHADLPDHRLLAEAPRAWVCGDLHLENFGSYKGDNRLVYFDLNDFDEGALAPCTWEILRLLTSILVAAPQFGAELKQARGLARHCLAAYRQALQAGKARWIDRDGATGLIGDLFDSLKSRKRRDFVESRTELKGKRRLLRTDGKRALPVSQEDRDKVLAFMTEFAARQENPAFFAPLDVARRIAGTGSLGVERYVILVEGKGGVDGHYLLDLKQALPSALLPRLKVKQPAWATEAERVVAVQERLQAISPAFLKAVELAGKPFVLKALQPSQDRVDLASPQVKSESLLELLVSFGRLVAWDQLRASGRQGAATADDLMVFAADPAWEGVLLELAEHCADLVQQQYQEFCATAPANLAANAGQG
ncbi:MAG TPA: DUF2252 family protein [Azospira sp.]|nr:DUF2252 family protein [Azospira sp.]